MNENGFKNKLKQIGRWLREWQKQTRQPILRVGSKFDKFVGLLQNEKDVAAAEHDKEDLNQPMAEQDADQQSATPTP